MKSNYHMITGLFHSDVTVVYQNGLPVISVRLPSRRERCQFTLKPISDSVGVFLRQLQEEDRGIDRVAIYSPGTVTFIINSHPTLISPQTTSACTHTHTLLLKNPTLLTLEHIFFAEQMSRETVISLAVLKI